MMKSKTLAWSFRCDQKLRPMRETLDRSWPSKWIEFDSDYKQDSIGAALTPTSAARIYQFGINFFIVNLTVKAEDTELDAQVAAGTGRLLNGVLPILAAREVKVTEPTDGT